MLIASATQIFSPSPDSFQKLELSDLRAGHREQLEDISAQLLLFEASLRGKEKQLQETLDRKDQVGSRNILQALLSQPSLWARTLRVINSNSQLLNPDLA